MTIVVTNDNEGQLRPCDWCSAEVGSGGSSRRATLLKQVRQGNSHMLLVDAGNAFYGGESVASGGKVVASAYDAMGYDVVNVSYRDFRLGKAATLALVKEAKFALISANLLDSEKGQLLLRPYMVKSVGGERVAVLGVTQEPAGLESLPHLQEQLAGIRIRPPIEALAEWLPKAKAEADKVILLYYGSVSGLAPIRQKFGGDLAAILVGDIPPDFLPADAKPPLVGAWSHGRQLAQVRFVTEGNQTKVEVTHLPVKPDIKPDPEMEKLIASYIKPPAERRPEAVAKSEPRRASSLPKVWELDRTYPLLSVASNRAVRLQVSDVAIRDKYGSQRPAEGRHFLVVNTEWENVIPLALLAERNMPAKYIIPNLGDRLCLVLNGGRLCRLRPDAGDLPGHVPVTGFALERIGSKVRGNVLFEVPASGIEALELRFYDYAQGHIAIPLMSRSPADQAAAPKPVALLQKNEFLEMGIYGVTSSKELGGKPAPAGMAYVTVDLRARSVFTFEADATAFDPAAKEGDRIEIGTVADWQEAHRYIQLVADGKDATGPAESTALSDEPRFLPDVMTGDQVVFLAPEKATTLELRCDFPNARAPGKEEVIHPKSIAFLLRRTTSVLVQKPPTMPNKEEPARLSEDEAAHVSKGEAAKVAKDEAAKVSKLPPVVVRQAQESEPNDERESANKIEMDTRLAGRINERRDWDYYVTTIPEPGVDTFVVQLAEVPEVKWRLELQDAEGKTLDTNESGEPGEGVEIVKMNFKPGTCYLEVRVESGEVQGAEYTLYAGRPAKPPATATEVQQALGKALEFLASKQQTDGSWPRYEQGYTGLCLMAFVGAKCSQKDYSANIKAATDYLKSQYQPSSKYPPGSKDAAYYGGAFGQDNMYQHAIATLALTETLVDQNDASLEPIVQDAINLVIRSQNTEHKPNTLDGPVGSDSPYYGGWRYEPDRTDSDLSITGWQILALRAAVNAGFSVPDHVFPSAAKFVRSLQGKSDGSFRYESPGDEGDSCARAGMGALSLQLCGFPQDPAIRPALRFMQDFAPRWNTEARGDGYAFYYWYYGTRAMYLAGGDDWRTWNDWMCRFLVEHQNPDGSWNGTDREEELDIYRAALGALMLEFCCGHVPIYMAPKRRVRGSVEVVFAEGAASQTAKNVELILDASKSMSERMDGTNKISVARDVLSQVVQKLPDNIHVALRVFGHRFRPADARTNTDSELVFPLGPIDRTRMIEAIKRIDPRGKTPLVYSILQATNEFKDIGKGTIVVVSDGLETCGGDIESIAPGLKQSGLDLRVNIVGFGIQEQKARQQLEAIAKSTGGEYLDARNAQGLLASLQETLQVPFVLTGDANTAAASGFVGGQPVEALEGNYTLRLMLEPEPLETKLTIHPAKRSTLVLKKGQDRWTVHEQSGDR